MKTKNTLSSRAGKTVLEVTSVVTTHESPYFDGSIPLSGLRIFLEYWTVPFYLGSYKRAVQFRLVALNTADGTMEEFEYGSMKPSLIFGAREGPMNFSECFGFSRNWTLRCVPVSDHVEIIQFNPKRYRTGETLDGIKVELPNLNWASDMAPSFEDEDGQEAFPKAPKKQRTNSHKFIFSKNYSRIQKEENSNEVAPVPQPAVPVVEVVGSEPVKNGQAEKKVIPKVKQPFFFKIPKV
ncbi:MAG: hypothetical protein AAB610_02215 [Patescibacteria group bacterium]